jgi:hypothetical protein
VAFTCTERILDETHMLSLAVHPQWRGQKLARTLVLASLWAARAAGQRLLTLEVRASNAPAIALYRSCGLRCVGQRPRYYRQPPEDALLLARPLQNEVPHGDSWGFEPLESEQSEPPPQQLEALLRSSGAAEAIIRGAATTSMAPESDGAFGELLGTLPAARTEAVHN